jgi:hypothetical protein
MRKRSTLLYREDYIMDKRAVERKESIHKSENNTGKKSGKPASKGEGQQTAITVRLRRQGRSKILRI